MDKVYCKGTFHLALLHFTLLLHFSFGARRSKLQVCRYLHDLSLLRYGLTVPLCGGLLHQELDLLNLRHVRSILALFSLLVVCFPALLITSCILVMKQLL